MRFARLDLFVPVCIAAHAFAQATVTYTLELGGDNHRSAWKSPPLCNPPLFTRGTTANGVSFCSIMTWAVRLGVSGTHSNGFEPSGVARFEFDLELRDASGERVSNFGKGSAASAGFFSSINDGIPRNPECDPTPQPDEAAAFAVSFMVDPGTGQYGRILDGHVIGGPGMTAYQYPATFNFPPGSTAQSGTLIGMSGGYSTFDPSGCPAGCGFGTGIQTASVGYTTHSTANCSVAVGIGPVAEGQLNLLSLPWGFYSLTVIPRTTLILNGDFNCEIDSSDDFALPADATVGSTRTFVSTSHCPGECLLETPPVRTIVGRHIFYNNSWYDTPNSSGINPCNAFHNGGQPCTDDSAIPSRIVALRAGQSLVAVQNPGPPISSSSQVNYSSYNKGINGIMIDVARQGCPLPAGPLSPAQVAATFEFVETVPGAGGRRVDAPYTGNNRTPSATVSIAPHPTLPNTDRIKVIFPDFTSTNSHWLRTRVRPGGVINGLPGEDRFYFGLAIAEGLSVTHGAGVPAAVVSTNDQTDPKPPNGHTSFTRASINDEYDYNRDSLVNTVDQTLPKPPNNTSTFTALILSGSAP